MSNLFNQFQKHGKAKLQKELSITNIMAVPKLLKIVVNTGLGEALTNKKVIETMSQQLAAICGQKPLVTHAKYDISTFKVRKGDAIGLKVTLRGYRMYDFFDKLVKIVLPRMRDFRGVSDLSFDTYGNITFGIPEQIVFPEIEYSKIDKIRSLEITVVTSSHDKTSAKSLFETLGIPFSKKSD